jgi:hypothetical protein
MVKVPSSSFLMRALFFASTSPLFPPVLPWPFYNAREKEIYGLASLSYKKASHKPLSLYELIEL